MGTISFNAKFTGMRKEQDFIVYPNPTEGRIMVQSDNRIGIICGDSIRIAKASYMVQFTIAAKLDDTIENIDELRAAIRGTAGDKVGNNGIVFCDNQTAAGV
jgi:hypothetical protein